MYYEKPLTFKAAQAIYTGMLFDTGSFRYPKTSAWTYRIAAHCMELGADPFRIYEYLYEKNSLSSFSLRSRILSSMEVMQNGRLIIMKLTPRCSGPRRLVLRGRAGHQPSSHGEGRGGQRPGQAGHCGTR
jgi:nanoRNase/pAp phosphatase (c-di-AMP/oligoRNAs hydrolase)